MTHAAGEEKIREGIRLSVRFDYRGEKTGKFLFGGKNTDKLAEETREKKAALLRNVPNK